jgi:hypothetical protein
MSFYSDKIWLIGQSQIPQRIREIELFKERQALPILMAAYNHLSLEEFTKLLRIVNVISF